MISRRLPTRALHWQCNWPRRRPAFKEPQNRWHEWRQKWSGLRANATGNSMTQSRSCRPCGKRLRRGRVRADARAVPLAKPPSIGPVRFGLLSAGRQYLVPVIRMTDEHRKLSESQFTLVSQSGLSGSTPATAAIGRTPVAGQDASPSIRYFFADCPRETRDLRKLQPPLSQIRGSRQVRRPLLGMFTNEDTG